MRYAISILTCSLLLFASTGCHFSAGFGRAPEQAEPMVPSIEGAWSEPVNGVRMKMMHVMPRGGSQPDLTLLLFVQNVGDKPVELPRIRPEHFVRIKHDGPQIEKRGLSDGNLMITAQPLDGHGAEYLTEVYQELSQEVEARNPLEPGEIRVTALKVVGEAHMKYQHQWSDDTLYAERIVWPGLNDKKSAGRWRLHVVYRPSGFNPPGSGVAWKVDEQWVDRQIDLPVTLLKLEPWHYHESGELQELNGQR